MDRDTKDPASKKEKKTLPKERLLVIGYLLVDPCGGVCVVGGRSEPRARRTKRAATATPLVLSRSLGKKKILRGSVFSRKAAAVDGFSSPVCPGRPRIHTRSSGWQAVKKKGGEDYEEDELGGLSRSFRA